MKHLFNAVTNCKTKIVAVPSMYYTKKNIILSLVVLILSGAFLFTSCKKQDVPAPANAMLSTDASTDMVNFTNNNLTDRELKAARQATVKYKSIDSAIADGYIDINVVMPNMGYHYQKPELVDSVFDITHPEMLVYNKDVDGNFKLVAVEYAIPLDQSVNAPKGFTGSQDVWDHNTDFGLWLLHAWVWKFNPDGVFNPTNPLVNVR